MLNSQLIIGYKLKTRLRRHVCNYALTKIHIRRYIVFKSKNINWLIRMIENWNDRIEFYSNLFIMT